MVYPHTMHILVCVLSVLNIMEHAIDYLIFHSTHMVVPFLLQEPQKRSVLKYTHISWVEEEVVNNI